MNSKTLSHWWSVTWVFFIEPVGFLKWTFLEMPNNLSINLLSYIFNSLLKKKPRIFLAFSRRTCALSVRRASAAGIIFQKYAGEKMMNSLYCVCESAPFLFFIILRPICYHNTEWNHRLYSLSGFIEYSQKCRNHDVFSYLIRGKYFEQHVWFSYAFLFVEIILVEYCGVFIRLFMSYNALMSLMTCGMTCPFIWRSIWTEWSSSFQ